MKNDDIPVFTPPSSSKEDDIPVFAPPASSNENRLVCFHHPNESAAGQCTRCGKYICKDCCEAYTVESGEYAGKCLCYDCCQQIVENNIAELTLNKKKIKFQFILSIIGMVAGFLLGFITQISSLYGTFGSALMAGIMYGLIGGVFLRAVKGYLNIAWEMLKSMLLSLGSKDGVIVWIISCFWGMIQMCWLFITCSYETITNTIRYINYLKRTSHCIEQDQLALQNMRAYMEYTLIRGQNKGVDLESLMNEGSELYNNSYARAVRNNGEEFADSMIRQATTTIAANGEIIRSFRE